MRTHRLLPLIAAFSGATAVALPLHAQPFNVVEATITDVQQALASGRLTCRALVQQYLDRIDAFDKAGPTLNSIQHVNARALAEADSLDALPRTAPRGPLHCVPVLLKDQVETRDMPTTYGSALFKDFVPLRDATIVQKLEAAGAIILAKTTMGEFAQRFVGSAAGIVRNAYDPSRNPSGSSAGSGTAVAANLGLVGIGEDTGGSIRGPAAVNALVGLRPTLGLVSVFGMMPANPTQDVLGPMTRTVEDAARVLDVIAGYDARDPITARSVGLQPASYRDALQASAPRAGATRGTTRTNALRGVRVGVLRTVRDSVADLGRARRDTSLSPDSVARLEARVRAQHVEYAKGGAVFARAIDDLRTLGAVVMDSLVVPPPSGRRVGNSFETEEATDAYLRQHPNAPVRTLKEILLAGVVNPWRARSLIGYVGKTTRDPDYLTVLQNREAQRTAVLALMAEHQLDALVYATYDAAPTRIADDVLTNPRPDDEYGLGDNRGLSPEIGFPALTVPAGFTTDALPIGLELLGRPFTEARLLGIGHAYEQATRHRRPPTTAPTLK